MLKMNKRREKTPKEESSQKSQRLQKPKTTQKNPEEKTRK